MSRSLTRSFGYFEQGSAGDLGENLVEARATK
jgi:hypothetical protein